MKILKKMLIVVIMSVLLCGSFLTANLTNDVSANEDDYTIGNDGIITKYTGSDKDIVIPNSVKGTSVIGIGDGAFESKGITSIIIPDSVEIIGMLAFIENELTSITIPDSVKIIGDGAFAFNNLTSVIISESVTSIGKAAFAFNNLTFVNIPNSVEIIGEESFLRNELTSIIIPDSVEIIGTFAFMGNELISITIPNKVIKIETCAFAENYLTSVIIPDSVKTIGEGAFSYNKLTSVIIPDTLTTIGEGAFQYNRIVSSDAVTINTNIQRTCGEEIFNYQELLDKRELNGEVYSYKLPNFISSLDNFGYNTINSTFNKGNKLLTWNDEYDINDEIYYNLEIKLSDAATQTSKVNIRFPMYTITFEDEKGNKTYEQSVAHGDDAKIPAELLKSDYTLIDCKKEITNITSDKTIILKFKKLPTITNIDTVKHKYGQVFDPKAPIKILDADGKLITDIKINENNVDINKSGTYTVKYTATDVWGGSVSGQYDVEVLKHETPEQPVEKEPTDKESNVVNTGLITYKGLYETMFILSFCSCIVLIKKLKKN